jgi:chorismate synthase
LSLDTHGERWYIDCGGAVERASKAPAPAKTKMAKNRTQLITDAEKAASRMEEAIVEFRKARAALVGDGVTLAQTDPTAGIGEKVFETVTN